MILSIPFLLIDLILGIYINSYFNLFLIVCLGYYTKYRYERNISFVLLIGFIYDLIFSGVLFLNTFIYLIIYIFTNKIRGINIYLVYFIDIIVYLLLNYLLLYVYNDFYFNPFFIIKTTLFNFIVFQIVSISYKKFTM
jgi:hypothetical protein